MIDNFKDIFKDLTKPQKKYLIIVILINIFVSFMEMLSVASLIPFVSVLIDASIIDKNIYLNNTYKYFEFENIYNFNIFLGLVFFSLVLVTNILFIINIWITNFINFRIGAEISKKLFNRHLSNNFILKTQKTASDLSSRIVIEVHRFIDGVLASYVTLIFKSFFLISVFILLLFFNFKVTLIVFIFLLLFYFLVFKIIKSRVKSYGEKISEIHKKRLKLIAEVFNGIKEVKIYNQTDYFNSIFEKNSKNINKKIAFNRSIAITPRYLLELIFLGALSFIVIMSNVSQNSTLLTFIPTFTVYIFAGYKLLPSAQTIFSAATTLSSEISSYLRFKNDLKKNEKLINDSSKKIYLNKNISFNQKIEIKNLYLKFEESNFELSNINFELLKNECFGIFGKSGSGKTTIMNLLCGFLKQDDGKILVDDNDLQELEITSWWKNISYVPQSVYIFDDNLLRNVIMNDAFDEKKFTETINLVGLGYMLENDFHINVNLGEKGSKVSGGEAQRIGIARAMYKYPKILILDEFTSALDKKNEEIILNFLLKLKGTVTIILISHKEEVLKICDKKIMIENGKLINTIN
jgi:ABC-type multidrug transport system fused ATPase/permease subunit